MLSAGDDPVEEEYLDFTAALEQLPSFQPYSYPSDGTVEPRQVGTDTTFSPNYGEINSADSARVLAAEPSTEADASHSKSHKYKNAVGNYARLFGPPTAYEIDLIISQGLRDIARYRDLLLDAQLKVEETEVQLAINRTVIMRKVREVRRIINRALNDADSGALIACELDNASKALKQLSRKQEKDEMALSKEQRQVTLEQGGLKAAVDDLYAKLNNGAQIGDSEAEMEDERLARLGFHTSLNAEATSSTDSAYRPTSPTEPGEAADDFTIDQEFSDAADELNDLNSLDGLSRMFDGVHESQVVRLSRAIQPQGQVKSKPPRIRSNEPALRGWGSQYPVSPDELQSVRRNAQDTPLLQSAKHIIEIRREDLKPDLSIDLNDNLPLGGEQTSLAINETNKSIYNPISRWGSSMSCNTLTELIRTALHHRYKSGSEQVCLFDLIDFDHLDESPPDVNLISVIGLLRKKDLLALEFTIPKPVPASLQLHFTGHDTMLQSQVTTTEIAVSQTESSLPLVAASTRVPLHFQYAS